MKNSTRKTIISVDILKIVKTVRTMTVAASVFDIMRAWHNKFIRTNDQGCCMYAAVQPDLAYTEGFYFHRHK